jgi:type VI secretion system protein ImpL
VAGAPGQRPLDALTQNFREIYQSVRLAADVPAQTDQANANLQLQISTLRANASRLPKALARMVSAAADDFEGTVAETSTTHLNEMLEETVGRPCEEVIAGRFPFAPAGTDDVAMADFARLFSPGGVLDRFFAQNLASLVDMSGQDWDWKQDTKFGRNLAKSTLRNFQLAAQIRAAFFPLGGPVPSINITFTPLSLHGDADMALLNIDGQVLQATQAGNTPGLIPWPGKTGSASLSLTPELPGRESAIKFDGPWALKRLLDKGQVTANGDSLEAHFVIGGRDVAYTIKTGEDGNPFTLPALSAFSCPKAF